MYKTLSSKHVHLFYSMQRKIAPPGWPQAWSSKFKRLVISDRYFEGRMETPCVWEKDKKERNAKIFFKNFIFIQNLRLVSAVIQKKPKKSVFPSSLQNTSPKWLTLLKNKLLAWCHPGRAILRYMLWKRCTCILLRVLYCKKKL